MGLFDKAADRFKRSGEETIRIVDYDALPENEQPEPEMKAPREPKRKTPRPKLGDLIPKGKVKATQSDELPDELEDISLEDAMQFPMVEDTVFELDDDEPNFYEQTQAAWDEQEKSSSSAFDSLVDKGRKGRKGKKNDVEYNEEKIADVLEVLKIPATFAIHSDVLMPDDFSGIDFDLQMPQGYDIGQVEFFVERSEASIREYMRLLETRNEHIALLATTIDRLSVDLQNLKYDNQIATGIGIMPTSDNDDLERENVELKLKIKRLEDEIKAKAKIPVLTSEEREIYEALRDQYSMLQRDNADLREQVATLKTKIAQAEENAEDATWTPDLSRLDSFVDDDDPESFELPSTLPEPPMKSNAPQKTSDGVVKKEPRQLPSVLPSIDGQAALQPATPDAFDFESLAEPAVEQPSIVTDDDEDDLDKLMKGWGTP